MKTGKVVTILKNILTEIENNEKYDFLSRPSQLSDIEILQNVSGLVTTSS